MLGREGPPGCKASLKSGVIWGAGLGAPAKGTSLEQVGAPDKSCPARLVAGGHASQEEMGPSGVGGLPLSLPPLKNVGALAPHTPQGALVQDPAQD